MISGSYAGQANPGFSYDLNGNMVSTGNNSGRSITWTSFDMPATITRTLASSSNTATFVYGPEHQRVRQTVTGSNPIMIYYAGAIEKEVTGTGTTVKTRMPRGVGYLSDSTSDTAVRYRYQRGDHLGSSVILTDDTGAVLDRDLYDARGQRRNTDGSDDTTYTSTWSFSRSTRIGSQTRDVRSAAAASVGQRMEAAIEVEEEDSLGKYKTDPLC